MEKQVKSKIFVQSQGKLNYEWSDYMRIKPQQLGKNVRMSYAKVKDIIEMPDLLEVQK